MLVANPPPVHCQDREQRWVGAWPVCVAAWPRLGEAAVEGAAWAAARLSGYCHASSMRCPACGFENPDGFSFCGNCATPLTVESDRASAEERRQVTVLFSDLVGSTELAERLDPEELRVLVRRYQSAAARAVERFDGHIAQYLGDGILVYFGFPVAHEDDPRRAVLAGLELVRAVARLDRLVEDLELAVRVGIHTGLVVTGHVGAGRRLEQLAMGQTPNIAARVQSLAAKNSVLVGASTQRLVASFFIWKSLGEHKLKGIAEPLELFQALAESDSARDSLRAGEAALFGREAELGHVREAWSSARGGSGRVVLLSGEAGVGKSKLIQQTLRELESEAQPLTLACTELAQHSAYQPLIALLARSCELSRTDSQDTKLNKIEAFADAQGLVRRNAVPALAMLLAVDLPAQYAEPPMLPQKQKERAHQLLLQVLLQRASPERPRLLVVEDLHWLDPSTREVLEQLVGAAPSYPLLLLASTREVGPPPWPGEHVSLLHLQELDGAASRRLAESVAGAKLTDEVANRILERTGGVPLFVREVTRMLVDTGKLCASGAGTVLDVAGDLGSDIPDTLQASLMARLDRLGSAKNVAQLASVIGREFSYQMLQALSNEPELQLRSDVARLTHAELLTQRGLAPHAVYEFNHALIRDVAYGSLLKSSRRQFHRRMAETLRERFPDRVERQPELAAHHFAEAGLPGPAADLWLAAGKRDVARSANAEAISHLRAALAQLQQDARADAAALELELQVTLAPALVAVRTYASDEVADAYGRALELCAQVGRTPQLFLTLWGLWTYYLVTGKLDRCLELGEQMRELGDQSQDNSVRLGAEVALGVTRMYRAELQASLRHLERANELDDRERDRSLAFSTGQDIGLVGRLSAAVVLWLTGEPDEALSRCEAAVKLARDMGHPFSLAFSLHFGALIRQFRGERREIADWARELVTLCEEHGFVWWLACGHMQTAWSALDDPAQRAGSLDMMRQAQAGLAAYGCVNGQSHFLCIEAESLLQAGELERARERVADARRFARISNECHCDAEIERLEGELLLAQASPDRPAAEAAFRRALDIAASQGAHAWRLKAATSLARPLNGDAESRVLLREASERVHGGGRDPLAARALLDE